jgi:colicin import membrane protein
MARKLKTYTTSAGFFDLAIAAPSMKAALEAWGSRSNLFQHGFAKVSDDPEIVAATMAKPGVVLRRPVGSNTRFSEDAKLPTDLLTGKLERKPAKRKTQKAEPKPKNVDGKAMGAAERQAALAFEKEEKRREAERRREEARLKKERERREQAIAAAETALDEARQDHDRRVEEIEKDRAALDRRSEAEDARWRKKKEQLEEALRRARSSSHLRLV